MNRRMTEAEFEAKYYQYYKLLYRIAYGYLHNNFDSEDILQNVFLKFLDCNKEFENEKHERNWLIRVTINQSIDLLRKKNRSRITYDEEYVTNYSDSSQTPLTPREQKLYDCVDSLKGREKEVIILYYFNNYSYEEIGEALGISKTTVSRVMVKAKEKIKVMMEEKFDD